MARRLEVEMVGELTTRARINRALDRLGWTVASLGKGGHAMQAIEHVIGAMRAESVAELEREVDAAKRSIDSLEIARLAELEHEAKNARNRLSGSGPLEAVARDRRPVRDDPQA